MKGDTVAIVAPSWWAIDQENVMHEAKRLLSNWGLEVVLGKSIGPRYGQFAGNDAVRQGDLQVMLDDPMIKMIWAYRGGHGATRIIDQLDFTQFLQRPKWIVGFSDITTLHLKAHQLGIAAIHGEMPRHCPDSLYQNSMDSLYNILFNGKTHIEAPTHGYNRIGTATGPVVGGNLAMICANIGTEIDLNTEGKILVIEDIGEQLYAVDRMLVQLKRTGKLTHLAGLIVGSMTSMKNSPPSFGKSVQAIVKEHVEAYTFPVAYHFPIGHQAPNMAFIHGAIGTLSVTEQSATLDFLCNSN
eukprot:gene338-430_t